MTLRQDARVFFGVLLVIFDGRVCQQPVNMPMGTNCTPLLTDLFLYSYKADLIQGFLTKYFYVW